MDRRKNRFQQLAGYDSSSGEETSDEESDLPENFVSDYKFLYEKTHIKAFDHQEKIPLAQRSEILKEFCGVLQGLISSKQFPYPFQNLVLPDKNTMYKYLTKRRNPIYGIKYLKREGITVGKIRLNEQDFWLGESLSDHYNETERLKARRANRFLSPLESWNTPETFLGTLVNNTISFSLLYDVLNVRSKVIDGKITPTTEKKIVNIYDLMTREEIAYINNFVYNLFSPCTIFRPSWGRGIIEFLFSSLNNTRRGEIKILDPSSGWGDRLISATMFDMTYHGYDPNKGLKGGHDNIIKDFGNPKKQIIKYIPFEESKIVEKYDLIFTSPPFFDIEIYSDDENQSISKYPEFENWLRKWLTPMISKMWDCLKDNGYLALYLGDTPRRRIIDPVKKFIRTLKDSSLYAKISLSEYKGVEILIWQKTIDDGWGMVSGSSPSRVSNKRNGRNGRKKWTT